MQMLTLKDNVPQQIFLQLKKNCFSNFNTEQIQQKSKNWNNLEMVKQIFKNFEYDPYTKNDLLKKYIVKWEALKKILTYVKKFNLQRFYQPEYYKPNLHILEEISPIMFQNMIFLKLNNCNIQNIEALSWINCPCIMSISLEDNFIVCFRSLGRCSFKHLRQFYIVSNTCASTQKIIQGFLRPFQRFNFLKSEEIDGRKNFRFLHIGCQRKNTDPLMQKLSLCPILKAIYIEFIKCQYEDSQKQNIAWSSSQRQNLQRDYEQFKQPMYKISRRFSRRYIGVIMN